MESLHLLGYIIIFLPLIASFLCFLIGISYSNFIIYCLANTLVIVLAFYLFFSLPDYKTHIVSASDPNAILMAIDYNIGALGLFFIILVAFLKFLIIVFYQNIIRKTFNEDSRRVFYSLNLLNLFAAIGIFTSNNIINLFLFIELYSLTFYAISCSSKEVFLNRLAFRYFYQSVCGSIFILFSLILLFINFNSANFDNILLAIENIYSLNDLVAISLIFIIFVMGVVLKFFPFWINFQNIRSTSFLSHFFLARILFIKVNIGFYILLKFSFLLFGSFLIFSQLRIDSVVFAIALLLTFYGNIGILRNNNFKIIITYYCLTFFGLFLLSLSINEIDSLMAAILFICHYSFVGLLLAFICGYMSDNFNSCNIKNLSFLKQKGKVGNYLFKILVFSISAFPLTLLFFANWHLSYILLDSSYIIIGLIPILTSAIVFANLAVKMISYFYFDSRTLNRVFTTNDLQDNICPLLSIFGVGLVVILLAINPKFTLTISEGLSFYLK